MPTPRSKLQSTNPPHLTGLLRPHIKSARKLTVHNNLPTNNLFHSLTPTPTIWRKAELPQAQVCGNPIPSHPIQSNPPALQHSTASTAHSQERSNALSTTHLTSTQAQPSLIQFRKLTTMLLSKPRNLERAPTPLAPNTPNIRIGTPYNITHEAARRTGQIPRLRALHHRRCHRLQGEGHRGS